MGLGMTKTFNINTYKRCCFYWSFNEKLEYFIKTCTQSWKNDIVIISVSFNKLYLYERRIKNMKRFLILYTSGLLMSTNKPLCNLQTIFVAEIVRKNDRVRGAQFLKKEGILSKGVKRGDRAIFSTKKNLFNRDVVATARFGLFFQSFFYTNIHLIFICWKTMEGS